MCNSLLIDLYHKTSKHSHYQVVATPLKEIIPDDMQNIRSRWEEERLRYIDKHLPCKDISLADIGGNTGYFTLEFIHRGAKAAAFIEGNKAHSDFVREAASALGWQDKVTIHPWYMTFEDDISLIEVDVTLLLNVLHHVGDDYGDQSQSISAAKRSVLRSLYLLSYRTKYLAFQLGFNWKGDINLPLFEGGTKRELINFVEYGVRGSWEINNIGAAEKINGTVTYNEINSDNVKRNDSLGEFLNRPLFIMESKRYGSEVI
jgi:hypothetical protein